MRIGALPLSRTRLLPSAIAAFLAQHPGITLMTNESPYESLVADMRAGNIDFIIGALRQDEDLPDLCSEALFEEDMLILLRNNHPLLRHPDPRSQLATAQWVLPRANAPARNLLDKAFVTLGLPLPQPTVETGDAAMVRGLLQGSDMLAAVSASQMRFETDNGLLSVLPVPLPDTTRRIGLTFRAGSLPSPATQALLRLFISRFRTGPFNVYPPPNRLPAGCAFAETPPASARASRRKYAGWIRRPPRPFSPAGRSWRHIELIPASRAR